MHPRSAITGTVSESPLLWALNAEGAAKPLVFCSCPFAFCSQHLSFTSNRSAKLAMVSAVCNALYAGCNRLTSHYRDQKYPLDMGTAKECSRVSPGGKKASWCRTGGCGLGQSCQWSDSRLLFFLPVTTSMVGWPK